jgi:hypothetical protein
MADATDSKSVFERSAGSSPASGTNLQGCSVDYVVDFCWLRLFGCGLLVSDWRVVLLVSQELPRPFFEIALKLVFERQT